ncbi:DUF732 domain-containing protein [Rhodococcus sp. NPDC003318]|uniref:DUF732 domain-containing protein n=1 Tax=Rhodococcus sp. NPDC003318 TaxID=3364503 RepID=UPI0036BD4EBC
MLFPSRTPLVKALAVASFAAVSVGVLAGCGSDDSTASSTPTLTTAAGSGSPTVPPLATGIEVPAYTTPSVAATAPPETPEPVPSGFPGPTEVPPIDDRGRAFLAELEEHGVTYADNGNIAISTANYICAAKQSNVADAEILAYVTGMAGVEAGLTGGTPSEADAVMHAQVYIDAATSTYCS